MDPLRIPYFNQKKLFPNSNDDVAEFTHQKAHVRIFAAQRSMFGDCFPEEMNVERRTRCSQMDSDVCPWCGKSLWICSRKQFFVHMEINWIYDNFEMDVWRSNVPIQWNDDKWKHFIKVSVAGAVVLFTVKNRKGRNFRHWIKWDSEVDAMNEHAISIEYWLKSICATMNK